MNLKPLQYYDDEYDRMTVALCRQREQKHKVILGGANTEEEKIWHGLLFKLMMYFDVGMFAGERWENKKKAVAKQMERDRARDTLLAMTEAPEPIHCLTCRAPMKVIGKEIDETGADGRDCILFFFECPTGCKRRRAFFHTSEEYRPKVHRCPKCQSAMEGSSVREKDELILTDTCKRCGHVETTRFSTVVEAPVPDPDFMPDYQRFCFTDEQGETYLKDKVHQEMMLSLDKVRKAEEEKTELSARLAKIRKLDITEVVQLLSTRLEKNQYGKLHLSAPEIKKVFVVPFSIQNLKEGRTEHEAIVELQKCIRVILAPTNWRLMSDGIYSQLGVLLGRLRGYDREHELIELTEKDERKNAKSGHKTSDTAEN
jgi:transcription elongation factor Elf1